MRSTTSTAAVAAGALVLVAGSLAAAQDAPILPESQSRSNIHSSVSFDQNAPAEAPQPQASQETEHFAEAPFRMTAHKLTPTQLREQFPTNQRGEEQSVARQWKEVLLFAIRRDFARPTVHARNLYHTSAAMYDGWAAYDGLADQVFHQEKVNAKDLEAARDETIAFAAYRVLRHRFAGSPGAFFSLFEMDNLMTAQGYDRTFTSTEGDSPAALGNRIAATIIEFGLTDGSNEQNDYANLVYEAWNPPLLPALPGNPDIIDPDRWQPLALELFIDQSGNIVPGPYPDFLSPEWGEVTPFSLRDQDLTVRSRDGIDWKLYHDPGPPPLFEEETDRYKWGNEMVVVWSAHLDPTDGVLWDIGPNARGNSPLPTLADESEYYLFMEGNDWGEGYDENPFTGEPYPVNEVPRGDYGRVLAEFWADGPDSETPPGHWFEIASYVFDHPLFERRMLGAGPELDQLEWDVKAYLILGGGMHDVAVSAWGVKGYYDYIRPVSAIRYMCDQGQCSDEDGPSYHPNGINLLPGYIEVITDATTAVGQRHEHLAGEEGKIAIMAWRGPEFIDNEATDTAGVGWILAENWWPYQRPSFVTPPFAGYVSGHSTFSRAASEIMTQLTGTPYFPGGVGEFEAPQDEFLVFEDGPSVDVVLQWATYRDASDQTSLSRIWGGIHPPADDIPGRQMGELIGPDALVEARRYFNGQKSCPADFTRDTLVSPVDVTSYIDAYIAGDLTADLAAPFRTLNFLDLGAFLEAYNQGCP